MALTERLGVSPTISRAPLRGRPIEFMKPPQSPEVNQHEERITSDPLYATLQDLSSRATAEGSHPSDHLKVTRKLEDIPDQLRSLMAGIESIEDLGQAHPTAVQLDDEISGEFYHGVVRSEKDRMSIPTFVFDFRWKARMGTEETQESMESSTRQMRLQVYEIPNGRVIQSIHAQTDSSPGKKRWLSLDRLVKRKQSDQGHDYGSQWSRETQSLVATQAASFFK
jgi:hypothetical protein